MNRSSDAVWAEVSTAAGALDFRSGSSDAQDGAPAEARFNVKVLEPAARMLGLRKGQKAAVRVGRFDDGCALELEADGARIVVMGGTRPEVLGESETILAEEKAEAGADGKDRRERLDDLRKRAAAAADGARAMFCRFEAASRRADTREMVSLYGMVRGRVLEVRDIAEAAEAWVPTLEGNASEARKARRKELRDWASAVVRHATRTLEEDRRARRTLEAKARNFERFRGGEITTMIRETLVQFPEVEAYAPAPAPEAEDKAPHTFGPTGLAGHRAALERKGLEVPHDVAPAAETAPEAAEDLEAAPESEAAEDRAPAVAQEAPGASSEAVTEAVPSPAPEAAEDSIEAEDAPLPEVRKWKVDGAGPIQTKRVARAHSALEWESRTVRELSGVRGGLEHESITTGLFGKVTNRRALELLAEIGARYAWTITKRDAKAITDDLKRAVLEARSAVPTVDNRISPEEDAKRRAEMEARDEEARARSAAAEASMASIMAKRPARAAALIVAELDQDESDSMTDYFGHTTTRRVAIGWRTGSREDFRQLRKAAAAFAPTAHLGPDAPDSVEHRDNYSMGGGNYVKAGGQHSSGWKVRSYPIGPNGTPGGVFGVLEDALPEPAAGRAAAASSTVMGAGSYADGAEVIKTWHAKRGHDVWIVVPETRTDRETFEALRAEAKAAGGWYSRKWGRVPGGFAFASEDDARAFAAEHFGAETEDGPEDEGPGGGATAPEAEAAEDQAEGPAVAQVAPETPAEDLEAPAPVTGAAPSAEAETPAPAHEPVAYVAPGGFRCTCGGAFRIVEAMRQHLETCDGSPFHRLPEDDPDGPRGGAPTPEAEDRAPVAREIPAGEEWRDCPGECERAHVEAFMTRCPDGSLRCAPCATLVEGRSGRGKLDVGGLEPSDTPGERTAAPAVAASLGADPFLAIGGGPGRAKLSRGDQVATLPAPPRRAPVTEAVPCSPPGAPVGTERPFTWSGTAEETSDAPAAPVLELAWKAVTERGDDRTLHLRPAAHRWGDGETLGRGHNLILAARMAAETVAKRKMTDAAGRPYRSVRTFGSDGTAHVARVPGASEPAPEGEAGAAARRDQEREALAQDLEARADTLAREIEHKRAPLTQNPTPRRLGIKASQHADADRLEQVERACRALAAATRENRVPEELAGVSTRAAIERALTAYRPTHLETRRRRALAALVEAWKTDDVEAEAEDAARRKAREREELENSVRFAKVEGFFPTPPDVITRMLEAADIRSGHVVDEPAAGIGHIVEAIQEHEPDATVRAWEISWTLADVMERKGLHVTGRDYFRDAPEVGTADRVVMNPPFERGQAPDFLRAAFESLRPGGRLVSIVPAGGRDDAELRAFVRGHGGTWEDLEAGAFEGPGVFRSTGVRTALVVVRKSPIRRNPTRLAGSQSSPGSTR